MRDCGRKVTAKDHVALTRVRFRVAGRIGFVSSDNQIVEAVPVDISRTADGKAALVKSVRAEDGDTGRAERVQIDRRRQRCSAEDHVAVTRTDFCVAGRRGIVSSDNQIVEAIAVHVPRTADGTAAAVARVCSEDGDAC